MNNGKGGIGCGTIIFMIILAIIFFAGGDGDTSSRSNYSSSSRSSYSNSDNFISDDELRDFVNSYDYDDFR